MALQLWSRRVPQREFLPLPDSGEMCALIREGVTMLKWAAIFLVIAVVAAILGFGGIAAGAVEIAKVLFFVFLILFVVTFIMGMRK
jgi:uncharacterized membrane protein YtjA (UPF0391 family)